MAGEYTTALKPARPQADLLPQELDVRVLCMHEGRQEDIPLRRRRTTFGRGDADVVIDDPTVSRKHFQIEVVRGNVVLHDLASANGTIYRGRWITSVNLRDGDHFQAGNSRFHIVIRTTNLMPARLLALVALAGEEGSALAGLLDTEVFAVRTVDPDALLDTCRFELPDLVVVDASARALAAVENLKRLPRLRNIHIVTLLGPEESGQEAKWRSAGANEVLERPVPAELLQGIAEQVARRPVSRELNFPVTVRTEEGRDGHGRLLNLHVRGARVRFDGRQRPKPGSTVSLKILLPNEYGVVQVRGIWHDDDGNEASVAFSHYEGNGQLQVRRIVNDAPMR